MRAISQARLSAEEKAEADANGGRGAAAARLIFTLDMSKMARVISEEFDAALADVLGRYLTEN